MTETDTTTGPARDTERDTERHGGRRTRFLLAASAGVAVVLAVSGVVVLRGEDKSVWPRPYDPAQALDISGVPGVSAEQEERARELVEAANKAAPLWADFEATKAAGWRSIGGHEFGAEHLVNPAMFLDGHFLDPTRPEALVYKVSGDGSRVFQAYMLITDPGYGLDHPELTGFAGRLIEWHNHSNFCGVVVPGRTVGNVAALADEDGNCPIPGGTNTFGMELPDGRVLPIAEFSMTHVWVVPHPCGPFAAVVANGFAEGVALVETEKRVDLCPEVQADIRVRPKPGQFTNSDGTDDR